MSNLTLMNVSTGRDINFPHRRPFLGHVTMDDSSHSIYLTRLFAAFGNKTEDGGFCTGQSRIVHHTCL